MYKHRHDTRRADALTRRGTGRTAKTTRTKTKTKTKTTPNDTPQARRRPRIRANRSARSRIARQRHPFAPPRPRGRLAAWRASPLVEPQRNDAM
ncbi:hypothetical protein A8H31_08200 [Burkholderia thailandensis]|nr:hypothetical protein WJ27_28860 [Burkholderia thailandensis]AVR07461.1 hypothetical protein A8H31_08200 [Burkholderia thailandensis]KVG21194.1 hypothetical protein WJ28_25745 [Burkholderia thailandensis]